MGIRDADRADVVVIGGGIVGCSATYHLRRAGAGHVVLLERAPELGTQTSWAGAGFVSIWGAEFPHWAELEMEITSAMRCQPGWLLPHLAQVATMQPPT